MAGCLLIIVASLAPLSGCRQTPTEPTPNESEEPEPTLPQRVHFPPSLRVEDHLVNELVEKAMTACVEGDYATFRLLWTARQEPMPRREFEHGWQAVTLIEVVALEPIRLTATADKSAKSGDEQVDDLADAYAIMAQVQLDPNTRPGAEEPRRVTISVIVKENKEWKLARAPKAVRNWLQEKVSPASADSEAPSTSAPTKSPEASP